MIGKIVKEAIQNGTTTRDDIFITSKIPPDFMGKEKSIECINQSLQNFDLDYIDLMLIHYPGTKGLKQDDPKNKQNRIETWKVLESYVKQGSIISIGLSNFTKNHVQEILEICEIKPVVNQIEIHPLYVEEDTIDFCMQNEILMQSYSPFARFDSRLIQHDIMKKIEKDSGIPVNKIILLWHIQKGFFVLPKSVHKERITDNFSIQGYELSDQQMKEIDSIHKEQQTKVCWDPKGIL
eukprot:403365823